MNLTLDCYEGLDGTHPQTYMKNLGISYALATAHPIGDCWRFWNCKNVPTNPLPRWLRRIEGSPLEYVGYGLSLADAQKLIQEGDND